MSAEHDDRQRDREKAARRGRAAQRTAFVEGRRGDVRQKDLDAAMARRLAADAERAETGRAEAERGAPRSRRRGPRGGSVALAMASTDIDRWVPIGPSVVRNGQALGRPRVVGRIRDLQVSPDGTRIYAASAKGGVWYSGDGGSTWDPLGGYTSFGGVIGGNEAPLVCGSLLVFFGAGAAGDHVMVGTGELVPSLRATGHDQWGGVGVYAATGPAVISVGANPWDLGTGIGVLEGLGIFRLSRHPNAIAGLEPPAPVLMPDTVVAATSGGLFTGVLTAGSYTWTREAQLDAMPAVGGPGRPMTDVEWLPGGPNGRLFVAVDSIGLFFSDDLDGVANPTYTQVAGIAPIGRMSLAASPGGALYVLGEQAIGVPAVNTPTLWRIALPNATPVAAPAAVANVPAIIWQRPGRQSQRDYDQAIVTESNGGTDRVYLGGSIVRPNPNDEAHGSVWCFDVTGAPAAPALSAVNTISTAADGAHIAGLVGNNIHPDIHAIRLAGPAAPNRHVWVGCDGGVFVSARAGRVNTFRQSGNGMAVLETGFASAHPTSSHFVTVGVQDNGSEVRAGDTVWELIQDADGGGNLFHPTRPDVIVSQFSGGHWNGVPPNRSTAPLNRGAGGGGGSGGSAREAGNAAFYSSGAAIAHGAGGRVAIGTDRVWISDNLGTANAAAITWGVLPIGGTGVPPAPAAGPVLDAYTVNALGAMADNNPTFGVPAAGFGSVMAIKFATDTVVYALYQSGIVRYVEAPAGTWTDTTVLPDPGGTGPAIGTTVLTDLAPVPGSATDFYLTTTGETPAGVAPLVETCWFFTGGAFVSTLLRNQLDVPLPPAVPIFNGPLDPAYSAVVDAVTNNVYVGTATGVWRGAANAAAAPTPFTWNPYVNGLPPTGAQDLHIWTDPVAGGPRLLRTAMQSRGVWEVDLRGNPEPQRTYLRVHARDDRRRIPTPLANPRRTAGNNHVTFASPDIVVRPRANPAAAPVWRFAAAAHISPLVADIQNTYELWTFQTAFRWIYPSVIPTGAWDDPFEQLLLLHRSVLGLAAGPFLDQALWNAVVGGTRLDAAGAVNPLGADLAVYRPAWQTPTALSAVATEVDVIESVQPVAIVNDAWSVYREPCTVDVLLHHRDTRPIDPNDAVNPGTAFAMLLWQSGPSRPALLNTNLSALPVFAAGLAAAGALGAVPGGWNIATDNAGSALQTLPVRLDARVPRAVSIDVDLSTVAAGHFVLFVAIAGSTIDPCTAAAVAPTNTIAGLVRGWPHAAARLVRVFPR